MSGIVIQGMGAVSPAGWGCDPLRDALDHGQLLPVQDLQRPGSDTPLRVRRVPAPPSRPVFLSHPRLRRTSPITHFAVAAALEALGPDRERVQSGTLRLGLVVTTMIGCVNYSRRFYDETLQDPATASPLVFPETVFNAPAGHLAAFLGSTGVNYSLVGDPGVFLTGLALGADWLLRGRADGCLVIGAEECDWLVADAYGFFSREVRMAEGAGALYLRPAGVGTRGPRLVQVTDPALLFRERDRLDALNRVRAELDPVGPEELVCDSRTGVGRLDEAETRVWADCRGRRLSPKTVLGEGLTAAAGWQCILALSQLLRNRASSAVVSVLGCNEQAIGARFAGDPT